MSVHDSDWIEVWSHQGRGEVEHYVAIDKVLDPKPTPAIYEAYVKVELRAKAKPSDAAIHALCFESDVQMAATALPSLAVGACRVVYRDESGPGRRVRLTHGWRESAATRPPSPPAGPAAPADGTEVELAALKLLAWKAAHDPDGEAIAAYHIQVSPRADFLHPVSPNFDRLIGGKPGWAVPTGWLVAGRTYHWRVRARDAWGAWSAWSNAWSFTVR